MNECFKITEIDGQKHIVIYPDEFYKREIETAPGGWMRCDMVLVKTNPDEPFIMDFSNPRIYWGEPVIILENGEKRKYCSWKTTDINFNGESYIVHDWFCDPWAELVNFLELRVFRLGLDDCIYRDSFPKYPDLFIERVCPSNSGHFYYHVMKPRRAILSIAKGYEHICRTPWKLIMGNVKENFGFNRDTFQFMLRYTMYLTDESYRLDCQKKYLEREYPIYYRNKNYSIFNYQIN